MVYSKPDVDRSSNELKNLFEQIYIIDWPLTFLSFLNSIAAHSRIRSIHSIKIEIDEKKERRFFKECTKIDIVLIRILRLVLAACQCLWCSVCRLPHWTYVCEVHARKHSGKMVFESIVTDLMNRFLGDFIENLDHKQLNIGIWGGKSFFKFDRYYLCVNNNVLIACEYIAKCLVCSENYSIVE